MTLFFLFYYGHLQNQKYLSWNKSPWHIYFIQAKLLCKLMMWLNQRRLHLTTKRQHPLNKVRLLSSIFFSNAFLCKSCYFHVTIIALLHFDLFMTPFPSTPFICLFLFIFYQLNRLGQALNIIQDSLQFYPIELCNSGNILHLQCPKSSC